MVQLLRESVEKSGSLNGVQIHEFVILVKINN